MMARPAWAKSVRFQLTLWYVTTLAAILLLTAALLFFGLQRAMLRETDTALATEASQVVRQLTAPVEPPDPGDSEDRPNPAAILAQDVPRSSTLRGLTTDPIYLRLSRADRPRNTVAVSPNLTAQSRLTAALSALPITERSLPLFVFTGPDEETQVRCLTVPVPGTGFLLQAAAPWDGTEDLLMRLMTGVGAAITLFLILSGVGSWLLVGRAFRPMERIVTEAEHLTADRLTATALSPGGVSDNEIGHLVAALNRMTARLGAAFTTQRQFTADASHELRTPLTILQGELELALARERPATDYRHALASGLEETRRLARIVDSLAFLARGDAGGTGFLTARRTPVSLTTLMEDAVQALKPAAQEKSQALVQNGKGQAIVSGDEEALSRVVRNLLDNAIRYTPPQGTITTSTEETPSECRLMVADTGIGIAPEDRPHVFDRFYRADKARVNDGGSGLGLSIAQSIVTAHGGRLDVESTPGVGSRFTLTLPKISEI